MGVGELLSKHNFVFNKRYGQNFITDGNLLRAIVKDAGITSEDTVVEVGAGAGTLTAVLAECAKRVIAVEIDTTLRGVLEEYLAPYDNVTLLFGDIMKVSDSELLSLAGGQYKVTANIPYYITTPVIMRFLEGGDATSVTMTMQKEVAERLVAAPSTPEYGSVTVAVQLLGKPTLTRTISRKSFFPAPEVDSAVLRIDVNKEMARLYPPVREIVRAGFNSRRKTLVNSLAKIGIDKARTQEALRQMGKSEALRAEALSPEEFITLTSLLKGSN